MKIMTYNEQLKQPQWLAKREIIKKRDGYKCVLCGWSRKEDLQVHHLHYIYGRMAWQYTNDSLQTLCRNCHIKAHKKPIPIIKLEVKRKSKTKKNGNA